MVEYDLKMVEFVRHLISIAGRPHTTIAKDAINIAKGNGIRHPVLIRSSKYIYKYGSGGKNSKFKTSRFSDQVDKHQTRLQRTWRLHASYQTSHHVPYRIRVDLGDIMYDVMYDMMCDKHHIIHSLLHIMCNCDESYGSHVLQPMTIVDNNRRRQ